MTEHLVVVGATGGVGRRVVHYALLEPRIASVTALIRSKPKNLSFYDISNAQEPKFKQITFDYATMRDDSQIPSDIESLGTYTCGISCLGVYTAQVTGGWEHFMAMEHAPNLAVARHLRGLGVDRYAYLSGMGAKQPSMSQSKPGVLQAMFSFVKGSTERDLASIMPSFTAVRPGAILGRENTQSGLNGLFESQLNSSLSWLKNTSYAIHCDDIAKGMIECVLERKPKKEILENNQIKGRVKAT